MLEAALVWFSERREEGNRRMIMVVGCQSGARFTLVSRSLRLAARHQVPALLGGHRCFVLLPITSGIPTSMALFGTSKPIPRTQKDFPGVRNHYANQLAQRKENCAVFLLIQVGIQ